MKRICKKAGLILMAAATAAVMTSCAYLPYLGIDPSAYVRQNAGSASGSNQIVIAGAPSEKNGGVTISKEEYERYKKFDTVLEVMDILEENFYQEVDEEKLLEGAIRGVLSGAEDHYTFYYNPEEYAELWEDDEGEYAGIGIQISSSYVTGISKVSRVFKNSPSEAAGVHRGDILYQVEDLYVSAANITDAVDIMRGTPGTTVHVTFLRDGEKIEMDVERANISVNRVDYTMLTDDIGYVYLYDFAGDCAQEFEKAVHEMAENGVQGLIVDLRDNSGGWVNDARSIGDLFVDKGILCYLEFRDGTREYYYTVDGKVDMKLVVLVNENSASSSEILTGCLQDRADATVVGVQSYGKGIVQSVVGLGEAGGMQLTIAQYFTPNGNAVHKIGITPDVEIALPAGDNGEYDFADLADPQLSRALEVMQEKLK